MGDGTGSTEHARPPSMGAPPATLKRLAGLVLDGLLPPQCLGCDAIVADAGSLCSQCWNDVAFIAPPQCAACGLPFAFDLGGEGALCGSCLRQPPPFRRARAAVIYDDVSRKLILAFKHGDRTDAAPALGRWMCRAGSGLVDDADLVVPVPLHWTRLFARRYNQAALLAQAVSRNTALPVETNLLSRRRRTRSQGNLSLAARQRNVGGAFAVAPAGANKLSNRRVLLVDDVMTTGATVAACSRALLKAGAGSVDVLTTARVVRPAL